MKINFNDSVKSLVDAGKIRYSTDIKTKIEAGEITKEDINALIRKMVNKDFGSVEAERARRFGNRLETGDKDIYGVYDDIILYYDASRDQLTAVTEDEFSHYYVVDWTETERKGFNERYNPQRRQLGPSMPTKEEDLPGWRETMLKEQHVLTEGQQRETKRIAEKEAVELAGGEDKVRDLRNFVRYEWKVWPVEDYTKFVKDFDNLVGKEARMNLVNLAKEYNIPVKRLYAIIMYYYNVQRKPYADGYNYIMKNLGKNRKLGIVASDTKGC